MMSSLKKTALVLAFVIGAHTAGVKQVLASCALIAENTPCRTQCDYLCYSWDWGGEIVWSIVECLDNCPDGQIARVRTYSCDPDEDPCLAPPQTCFSGDTKIATPGGEKEIKDIQAGERVLSINPETDETSESEVEKNYSVASEGYYEVTVELPDGTEETLKVTGEHPLYVKSGNPLTSALSLQSLLFSTKPSPGFPESFSFSFQLAKHAEIARAEILLEK